MTDHLFISYSRDDQGYMERLVACLRGEGLTVAVDLDTPGGDLWQARIESNIRTCAVFVLVMSAASKESAWVSREIGLAQNMKKPIVPLLLDGDLFWNLSELQAVDVRGGQPPGPDTIGRLRELAGLAPADPTGPVTVRAPAEPADPDGPPGTASRRRLIAAAGVVGLVAVTGGLWRLFTNDHATFPDATNGTSGPPSTGQTSGSANPNPNTSGPNTSGPPTTGTATGPGQGPTGPGGSTTPAGPSGGLGATLTDPPTVARTLTTGGTYVLGLAYSPNGTQLACASGNSPIIWNPDTGESPFSLVGHDSPPRTLAYSPAGDRIATGCGYDQTVRVWNAGTGGWLTTLPIYQDINGVAYSPNGKQLAAANSSYARVWNASNLGLIREFPPGYQTTAVAYSKDSSLMVLGGTSDTLSAWYSSSGDLKWEKTGWTVTALAVSPDGQHLAVGGDVGAIHIVRVTDGGLVVSLPEPGEQARSLAYSPDGTVLATGTNTGKVRLWRVSDATVLYPLSKHTLPVNGIAFRPGGGQLATGSQDGTVVLWRL